MGISGHSYSRDQFLNRLEVLRQSGFPNEVLTKASAEGTVGVIGECRKDTVDLIEETQSLRDAKDFPPVDGMYKLLRRWVRTLDRVSTFGRLHDTMGAP